MGENRRETGEERKYSQMYLAHISEDGKREETVKEHLLKTAERAEAFAAVFGAGSWGYACGLLHDIGKYSEKFQERIRGRNIRVDHSTAGAKVCWDKKGLYTFLSYPIAGHHAGLPDTGTGRDTEAQATMMARLKRAVEPYEAYKGELSVPVLESLPADFQKEGGDYPGFVQAFFIRMLYSCLVDADFLETEIFMGGGKNRQRDGGEPLSLLLENLKKHIQPWLENQGETINGRRTEILKACLEAGEEQRGLFRLTVPTGGGKTVSSLAFALSHGGRHRMKRVIYVIPYTSIIEQNAQVFKEILGQGNVLEDHCHVSYGVGEELDSMQLAAENWDKPVVVTTNVQFFESLFSNRPGTCRKLHNIADSVIIFDEVQMLPTDYLKPCVAVMEELILRYRCSMVLCTATQPDLGKQFRSSIPFRELCPRVEAQFSFFRRTVFQSIGTLSKENLAEQLQRKGQVLCIMNTKRGALELYQLLAAEESADKEGLFHLSTLMYPVHRRRTLERIRERLCKGKRCVVISTSLVEAGVDLDFQAVYRQAAGVDSMVQAAGRCNREGKRPWQDSVTSLFWLEDEKIPKGQALQIETGKMVLESLEKEASGTEGENGTRKVDLGAPEVVEKYFKILYHHRGEALDRKKIMEEFRPGRYPFAFVAKEFKLIDSPTRMILIPLEQEARELYEEIKRKGCSRALMRRAGLYSVNVYENEFLGLYNIGAIKEAAVSSGDGLYVLNQEEQYSQETGLAIHTERGEAIMM